MLPVEMDQGLSRKLVVEDINMRHTSKKYLTGATVIRGPVHNSHT